MRYIARKRARFKAIDGQVNISYGSPLEARDGFLFWEDKKICAVKSQNAYDYFSRDDDGQGLERGRLVAAILSRLERRDTAHQDRWNKVWDSPFCQQYKRPEHEDHWIWNYSFYNAPVDDLRRIAALVGCSTRGR